MHLTISQQVVDVEGASENSRTGEDDGLGDLHNCGGLHASDEPSQANGKARSMPNPGVVEHLEELTSLKPNILLSCKECTYKTNYLQRRMSKEDSQPPAQEPPRGS